MDYSADHIGDSGLWTGQEWEGISIGIGGKSVWIGLEDMKELRRLLTLAIAADQKKLKKWEDKMVITETNEVVTFKDKAGTRLELSIDQPDLGIFTNGAINLDAIEVQKLVEVLETWLYQE